MFRFNLLNKRFPEVAMTSRTRGVSSQPMPNAPIVIDMATSRKRNYSIFFF